MTHVQRSRVTAHQFEDDGSIPNNPALPLLLYSGALDFDREDAAAVCEQIFTTNGWGTTWRNGIFTYHHYHSTAHEVLAIAYGRAKVQLGGAQGLITTVTAGDVILIPAGGGHKNLGSSADLLVVGAYPQGQTWDLCYGRPEERPQVLWNIAAVPLPQTDPLFGRSGPLFEHWHGPS